MVQLSLSSLAIFFAIENPKSPLAPIIKTFLISILLQDYYKTSHHILYHFLKLLLFHLKMKKQNANLKV